MIDDRGFQEPIVEIAAAAERPEPALRVRETADQILGARDFVPDRVGIALQAKRHRMRIGVVADPVAFFTGPRRQKPALGIGKFFADDEESSLDAALAEDIQHVRRHLRLGPVIERQCQIEHAKLSVRSPAVLRWQECLPPRAARRASRSARSTPCPRSI